MVTLDQSLNVLYKIAHPATRRAAVEPRSGSVCAIMQMALEAMIRHQGCCGVTDRDIAVFGYLMRNPYANIILDRNVCNAFSSAERALKEDDRRRLEHCLQKT